MKYTPQQLHEEVNELVARIAQIQAHLQQTAIPVSKSTRDTFAYIHQHYEQFSKGIQSGDVDKLLQTAQTIAVFSKRISQLLMRTELDDISRNLVKEVGDISSQLKRKAEEDLLRPLDEMQVPRVVSPAVLPPQVMRKIEQFVLDQEKQDERVKRSLAENEKRLAALSDTLENLEKQATEVVGKIQEKYDQTQVALQAKEEQLNSILGHASGRVIAGDYEKSAISERRVADWLRWASLLCMALIAIALGYSFWETVTAEFQWQKSLFRVVLAFLLSAPAAYLARESSRHRVQQYQHHQTSLELKAISPYLASLPDEIQHKIKADVASRLFAAKDLSSLASDSYPVNTQELLMELVKKLELPKPQTGGK